MNYIKKASTQNTINDIETVNTVKNIIKDVRNKGDEVLINLAKKFDNVEVENLVITKEELKKAYEKVPKETLEHIEFAKNQIETYAKKQRECLLPLDFSSSIEGLKLGHKLVPVDSCGCYVPAGRYPLVSSSLMSIVPAKVAGVKRIVGVSPATKTHEGMDPSIMVAMDMAGADEIICTGGAQSIAALTYGTKSINPVDMIIGAGNKYVTEAKKQVMGTIGIDGLAGPSEVLIIADESGDADFIAMDLLAQSEHDTEASSILISTSQKLIDEVNKSIEKFLGELKTSETAKISWEAHGEIILADNLQECIEFSNKMAPEHVEIHTNDDDFVANELTHFGSMFVGKYASVPFGDFVSGTNHILPTMGTGRFASGVWVGTFIKVGFYQSMTKNAAKILAGHGEYIAHLEGLEGHERSMAIRRK